MMLGWVLLGPLGVSTAVVEWLPGDARAISRQDSFAADAPVTAIGYGPRAFARLGGDVGLLARRGSTVTFRIGLGGFVAFEDAEDRDPVASELGYGGFELGAAWSFDALAHGWLGTLGALELGLGIGRRSAFELGDFVLRDRYRPDDVPFGAGGWYVGIDGALRGRIGGRFALTTRLGLRTFTGFFPDVVGAHVASDHVANSLAEGAELSTSYEVSVRWLASGWAEPVVSLVLDTIVPHDDSARPRWLGRGVVGLALPGRAFELTPFCNVEAGHGQGLLVNRTELRLGGGLRLRAR